MLTLHPEIPDPEAAAFAVAFTSGCCSPRYVLGRNEYAAGIARSVDIDGFIDDYTSDVEFLGKPVVKMPDVPRGSLVVSAVIFVEPMTALTRLRGYGLPCLDYFKFAKYADMGCREVDYLREARDDAAANWGKYQWLFEELADSRSRSILESLVNFRCSGDLRYMSGFGNAQDRQYFEDLVPFSPGDVFVDVGGYDGQTTVAFVARCPEYAAVHVFEPDPDNYESALRNLADLRDVYVHNLGLADKKGTVQFRSGAGSASGASDTGDVEIRVDTLDRAVTGRVSMVKMDVEGAEVSVLDGAREHIRKDHPILAICSYHRVDDLWRIPEHVLRLRQDYAVHLRHYTEGLHETVTFFVPKSVRRTATRGAGEA